MRKKRILVIDDEAIIYDLVSLTLKKRGYEVIHASNGEMGLAKVKSRHPDLILLDIMMPGLDGHQVCARLKTNRETKRIPVIMLTGESDRAEVIKAHEFGADDYIVKPFTLGTLQERVNKYLGSDKATKTENLPWWKRLFRRNKRNGII